MKTTYKDFTFKARESFTANRNTIAKATAITTIGVGSTLAIVGAVKATTTTVHSLGVIDGVAKFAMVTAKAGLLHKVLIATTGVALATFAGVAVYTAISKDKK
jgi:hypothetical protein